jgi:hypothetical protein
MKFSWMVVLGTALAFLDCGCDLNYHHTATPEHRALREVIETKRAEERFYREFQRYGRAEELGPGGAKLISGNIVNGHYAGHRFILNAKNAEYTLSAFPESKESGRRSFFCDQTGVLRQSFGPDLATAQSPAVK